MSNSDSKTTPIATEVVVTPPTSAPAGGWDAYLLTLCPTSPAGACFSQHCDSPPKPSPATTTCKVIGLSADVHYTVAAVAEKGQITSKESTADTFKTPAE